MPCAICHQSGHNSTTCNHDLVQSAVNRIWEKINYNINCLNGYENLCPYEISPRFSLTLDSSHSLQDCIDRVRSRRISEIDYVQKSCINSVRNAIYAYIRLPLLKRTKELLLNRLRDSRESMLDTVLNDLRDQPFMAFRTKQHFGDFYGTLSFKFAEYNLPANYLSLEGLTRSQFRRIQDSFSMYPEHIQSMAREYIPNEDERDNLFESINSHHNHLIQRTIRRTQRRCNTVHIDSKPKYSIKMLSPDSDLFTSEDCPVCMDSLSEKETVSLSCKHSFCGNCINELVSRDCQNCPTCRGEIKEFLFKSNISPNIFNNLFSKLV